MNEKVPENRLSEAMQRACLEARRWLGATMPNPAVGAVALDAEGNILAAAAHRRAGESHAEMTLFEICRARNILAHVHTLCVTLEPCNHQGRTPPCTETIIQSGIKHVVIGTRDPNPKVAGGGIEKLRQAGIEVICGVGQEECRQLITSFTYQTQTGKPWITVKRAIDRTGSMIPPPGQKTFTAPESLKLAHRLRKKCDTIITGSGTILVDDPLFTVRYVPDFPGKRRRLVIIDRRKRVPENYMSSADARGQDPVFFDNIDEAMNFLTNENAQDVLVEAGPTLSQGIFEAGYWCIAVTIQEGDPDRIEVGFNSQVTIPFDTKQFNWEWYLPE